MAKRKFVCIVCGNAPQEIHKLCTSCHNFSLDDTVGVFGSNIGNDYLSRCSEEDCWICDSLAWEYKRTRPYKLSKKTLLRRAEGSMGPKLKELAIEELDKRGIKHPYEKTV